MVGEGDEAPREREREKGTFRKGGKKDDLWTKTLCGTTATPSGGSGLTPLIGAAGWATPCLGVRIEYPGCH